MLLYFLRHAEAEPDETNDSARKLTEKGLAQAEKAAKFIQSAGIVPEIILTSPKVRAKQTARPVARRLSETELSEVPWLASGPAPETFLKEISAYKNMAAVLLSGHEPDFSTIIAALIGLPQSESIHIRKASLTAVDLPEIELGRGTLEFSIPVRLM